MVGLLYSWSTLLSYSSSCLWSSHRSDLSLTTERTAHAVHTYIGLQLTLAAPHAHPRGSSRAPSRLLTLTLAAPVCLSYHPSFLSLPSSYAVSPQEEEERKLELQKLDLKPRGIMNAFEKKRKTLLQSFFRLSAIVAYDEDGNGTSYGAQRDRKTVA